MLKPKTPAPPAKLSIEERIQQLHQDISALIDARAAEIRKDYVGVFSHEQLVHDIKVRAWSCPCSQYRLMQEQN
jgi:hypothetical protein